MKHPNNSCRDNRILVMTKRTLMADMTSYWKSTNLNSESITQHLLLILLPSKRSPEISRTEQVDLLINIFINNFLCLLKASL